MALTASELAARYGYAAAFFYSNPELKKLLTTAVSKKYTPEKFQASFMATKWFKTHSGPVREWIGLEKSDPATAKQRVYGQKTKLLNLSRQFGLDIDAKTLNKLARDSLMWSWNDDQLRQTLSTYFKYSEDGLKGQTATFQGQIRDMAADYGVTLSEKLMESLVKGSISGRYGEDHAADYIKDYARSKYPGLRKEIDQGFTVRQIASPYLSSYAQLLEVDEESVDLNDRQLQQALQGKPSDDGKEPFQRLSVYEFEKQLRSDPRWRKTKNARDTAYSVGTKVLEDMGLMAG